MSRRSGVLLDTSIWVPYLRSGRYARTVDGWLADGRIWMHSMVLLELYAGTASTSDKRDIDAIGASFHALEQHVHPSQDDFRAAGQILSYHARTVGKIRHRDHKSRSPDRDRRRARRLRARHGEPARHAAMGRAVEEARRHPHRRGRAGSFVMASFALRGARASSCAWSSKGSLANSVVDKEW